MPFGQGSFTVSVQTANGVKIAKITGALPDGVSARIAISCSSGSGLTLPDGAIVANGDAKLTGQSNASTTPVNRHQASIRANGNVQMGGQSYIDGVAAAHGTVSTNGQAGAYGGIINGAPLVQFPTPDAIDAWQQQLISSAKAGTTLNGATVNKNTTWTSPVYVNGNLNITSQATLTINGGGVVYVSGSITISGQSKLINSGLLASGGTISCNGQSVYTVSTSSSSIGLVSFHGRSSSGTSIDITGQSSSSPFGIVYAANGSIKVTGQGDVYGALVAGGQNGKGTVDMSGQGNLYYPVDLLKNTTIFPGGFKVLSWVEL